MLALIKGVGLNLKDLGLEESAPKCLDSARLRKDISQKIKKWNERTLFALAGVKGLTLGDMHTLLMCCDVFDRYGSLNRVHPYNPDILTVLERYSGEEE